MMINNKRKSYVVVHPSHKQVTCATRTRFRNHFHHRFQRLYGRISRQYILCFCVKRTRITRRNDLTSVCHWFNLFPYKEIDNELGIDARIEFQASSIVDNSFLIESRAIFFLFFSLSISLSRARAISSKNFFFFRLLVQNFDMRPRICSFVFVLLCGVEIAFSIPASPPLSATEKPVLAVAATEECAPSVVWPVVYTLIVVAAIQLTFYFFWKFYWRIRHGKHLVLVTDVEKADPEFAFDNPGFREGTPVIAAKKLSSEAKEKASRKESDNSQKISNGHKPQSLNDSNSNTNTPTSDQKTCVIPLKSKDFTGLGFSICGNMRDGIFIKDLLHHGPASETGRIKAGDRVSAVRINFFHIKYEDAMSILSYASPYEIEIEVEDNSMSPGTLKNSSMNNLIDYSFFRNQSFNSSQQIQKIIPRKLNFNGPSIQTETPVHSKPAVLEVSEISDKMSRYGVKVLPEIKTQPANVNLNVSYTNVEKQQNATVIDIQSDSGIDAKSPTISFDEVDLSSPVQPAQSNDKPTLVSTFRDNNVKKVFVKSFQNVMEKFNNHIQKSNEKLGKENVLESMKLEGKPKSMEKLDVVDDSKSNDNIDLRLMRSNSDSSNEFDDSIKKASKRKAPPPPVVLSGITKEQNDFNLLNEIENEVNKNYTEKDGDSETEIQPLSNTIELNSCHVTVHHAPEESNRKASSLGDLSKIAEDDPNLCIASLERAVSLELADHTPRGSKKDKILLPPEETSVEESSVFGKDSKLIDRFGTKLKKSSLFGTLEEAVKRKDDESIPLDDENPLTSSTPMKQPEEENRFLSMDSCSNISWELNFDLQDDAKDNIFLDVEEKVPDLPTSPMPNMPTYVTEINVSNDGDDTTKVNSSDLTLFMTAAEININNSTDESKTSTEEGEVKPMAEELKSHEECNSKTESHLEVEDSKDDSSIDTVKEVSCNGSIGEEFHSNSGEMIIPQMTPNKNSSLKFSKENMSDEQIIALHSSSQSVPSQEVLTSSNQAEQTAQVSNSSAHSPQSPQSPRSSSSVQSTPKHRINNGDVANSKLKSSNQATKLPKLSQSLSPVKVIGSRIPVRANTEPSLKVSLINKDDCALKTRKYKLSEDGMENGKMTFNSANHLPSATHKTTMLSETRHNGPNR